MVGLVYLLYLQYNASVNISNSETQVSISRAAAGGGVRVLSQVQRRDEGRRRGFLNQGGPTKSSQNNTEEWTAGEEGERGKQKGKKKGGREKRKCMGQGQKKVIL